MPTRIIFYLLISLLTILFLNSKDALAFYNAVTGECEGEDSVEYLKASVCEENGKGPPPAVQCNRGDPDWIFSYPVCKVTTVKLLVGARCEFTYQYETSSCSATDTCRSTQYLYPAICSESSYDPARGPNSACLISGTRYKVCCTSSGQFGPVCQGGNYSGSCPNGTVTKFCGWGGYPSCDDPNVCGGSPPPPPPTCSEQLTCEYAEPDSTCPSGYRVVTGTGCDGFNCGCSYLAGCSTSTCAPGGPAPTPTPPPPVQDTQAPTCNSLTVSPTHGPAGTIVTITGSTQDNVKVTTMEFFQNSTSLATFNNGLNQNPFTQSYNWNTTGKTQGSYTIVVNAVDAAGNLMRGLENTCNKPYTVDPPPVTPWVPPVCSGTTFTGCNQQGQARCTDWGTPQNATCADACTRSNPNTYCVPNASASITVTPNPNSKAPPACTNWNNLNIATTTTNANGGQVFYKSGPAPQTGPCDDASGRCQGWGYITGYGSDGTNNAIFPPPGFLGNGQYAFGLFDGTVNQLLATDNVTFNASCATPPPAAPPPAGPPPPSGCSVTVSPGTVPPGGTVSVSITSGPEGTYYLTCPDGSSRGPGGRTASWMCSTSGLDPGTYSVDARGPGVSCSGNVIVQTSAADCREQRSWAILAYAVNDTSYDSSAWPEYTFNRYNYNYGACYPETPYYRGSGGSGCTGPADCNDNKPCTIDACVGQTDGDGNIVNGHCQNQPAADRTQCRTRNPNCWGWWYHIWNFRECTDPLPVCQSGICMSQSDANSNMKMCSTANDPVCNDNNSCTEDKCNIWDDGDGNIQGWCSNTITTGSSCQSGGTNGYCINSGQCSTYACKTNADCNDGNPCTKNDTCVGYQQAGCVDDGDGGCIQVQETLGICQSTNTPYAVCQGSAADPQKLCSPESPSQCNIDYIKCTSPSLNNQYCCGTINIQGESCHGNCVFNNLNNTLASSPKKAGIIIHADGDRCGLNFVGTTDERGIVQFNVPGVVGKRWPDMVDKVNYTMWAEIPPDQKFTRGYCYSARSGQYADNTWLVSASGNRAICQGTIRISYSSESQTTGYALFGFNLPSTPWIQTTGGDVHSNVRINTPGGP